MRKNIILLMVIGILTIWLSACRTNKIQETDRLRIHVTSLQKDWIQLEAEGVSWQSDAYFTGIIIPIIVDSPRPRELPLNANFLSTSTNQEMLVVMLNSAGEMSNTIIPLTQPLLDLPIVRSDWRIDSTEALAALLNDDDVKFLLSNSKTQCSNLYLERRPDIPTKPIMWRISIHDCGFSNYSHYEYLDPLTGERYKK
jgi:hypothetical protein